MDCNKLVHMARCGGARRTGRLAPSVPQDCRRLSTRRALSSWHARGAPQLRHDDLAIVSPRQEEPAELSHRSHAQLQAQIGLRVRLLIVRRRQGHRCHLSRYFATEITRRVGSGSEAS